MTEIGIDETRVVSDQALFDQIAEHLFKQGQPSLGEDGFYYYRDAKGRSCAIGCRIPDAVYNEALESYMVASAEVQTAAAIPDAQLMLALALQDAHDDFYHWATTKSMKARLIDIADEFELSQRILDDMAFSDR